MDANKYLVVLKGEDKTEDVISYTFQDDMVYVEFKAKIYCYKKRNVYVCNNPKVVDLHNRVAYHGDIPLYGIEQMLDFNAYIKVIYRNFPSQLFKREDITLIPNAVENENAKQILRYLKEISQFTNIEDENGDNPVAYLKERYDELTFVHPESVLATYLNQRQIKKNRIKKANIIFPFYVNISQRTAVKNALENSISIIEGPPGTGKTQTILNLIANLIDQNQTVAVVSGNNAAVKNVYDKLNKEGYGFIIASLGNKKNKTAFFNALPHPNVESWNEEESFDALQSRLGQLNQTLDQLLEQKNQKAILEQQKRALETEQKHFEQYYQNLNLDELTKLPFYKLNSDRIIAFLAENTLAKELGTTDTLVHKIKLFFKYGVYQYRYFKDHDIQIVLRLQREYYKLKLLMLNRQINQIETVLARASFDELRDMHQAYSVRIFRKKLIDAYADMGHPDFKIENYKGAFDKFIAQYPVLLSTTHALRKSIPENYLLDYVIIDESSQVDLLTGVLALSCCKNAVIVGDTKQLPQITNEDIKQKLSLSLITPEFDYFKQNILSSMLALYQFELPRVILKEHYRCHPTIIEFCNQKYYHGELIPLTAVDLSETPLILYYTAKGNHMRGVTRGDQKGKYNQRELDTIVEEVLANPALTTNTDKIGFTTPYRLQANKATDVLPKEMECDTIHKYQGREKDIMIMSTVLDNSVMGQCGIRFTDDPCKINVAVSRAIRQFILVTDHHLFQTKGKEIKDLVKYIQYNTLDKDIIESQVISVFDLLYREYSDKLCALKARVDRRSKFLSEDIIHAVLTDLLAQESYSNLIFTTQVLLKNLIAENEILTKEERAYIDHRASLDFVIYNKFDRKCVLAIEVDGFESHENNPRQLTRDALKDSILDKYQIPLLRLRTNGSGEEERIKEKLNELLNIHVHESKKSEK